MHEYRWTAKASMRNGRPSDARPQRRPCSARRTACAPRGYRIGATTEEWIGTMRIARVTERGEDIAYVDMRYTNGFAIGWRGNATHTAASGPHNA